MTLQKTEHKGRLNRENEFKAEVKRWAEKIKVKPRQIRIQAMKKKWASCSSQGRVCFSSDLLKEPKDFKEYVMVHELLHLEIPNHGRVFKSLLSAYLPDCEKVLTRRNNKLERQV
ncbi:MAG TPA: M48 family metallopeptidase [Thermodesulfobacteriota bacterium]|nr:M48 family metallopeptidase [Thermodesulfobacteriota bacterium]